MVKNRKSQKLNIICLSNQLWDFENWTNKKHVMFRLAKMGHNVLFVDPPINVGFVFYRYLKAGRWTLGRLLTQTKIDKFGLKIFSPLNPVPFTAIMAFFHAMRIRLIAAFSFKKENTTLLWIYNVEIPHLDTYLKYIPNDLLVYDCVDNYEGFPRYNTPEKKNLIKEIEKSLTAKSDLVFATAPGLVDKLKKYNKSVYYTPNVGDYERFKNIKKRKYRLPRDLSKIPTPRVGYIGAIDPYKFDSNLARKCAEDNPDFSFVFIGPIALKDKVGELSDLGLEGLPNVYYLGPVPYEKKEQYLAGFDVDIIPYVLNDYTVGGCFPVKFHDSLAAGLPVVVTNLPAYVPFRDVCYLSKNAEEFSNNIKLAIEEDSMKKIRERQVVAKKNSWDNKVKNMLDIIYKELRRR